MTRASEETVTFKGRVVCTECVNSRLCVASSSCFYKGPMEHTVIPKKPKYDADPGDPLDILAEEASEVIKEVMKIKRFGLKGMPEWFAATGKTPRDYVVQEVGDLNYIVKVLIARGFMTVNEMNEAAVKKRERMIELYGVERIEKFERG